MTIDDLSRTDDTTAVAIGPLSAAAVEPWIDLCGPDEQTGAVRGRVRILDQGDRTLRFGPQRLTTARGGLVAVNPATGQFTYTPSVSARQVSRTSADYRDKVDTFTVEVVDAFGARAEAHVVVDILPTDIVFSGAAMIGPASPNGVLTGRIDATAWDGARLTFGLKNSSNPSDAPLLSAFSENGALVRLDKSTGEFTFLPQAAEAPAQGPDVDRFVVTAVDPRGAATDITVVVRAHPRVEVRTLGTAAILGAPAQPSAGVKTATALGGAKEAQWYPITVAGDCTLSIHSTSGGTSALVLGPSGDHTLTFTSSGGSFLNRGPAGNVVLRVTDALGRSSDRTYTY